MKYEVNLSVYRVQLFIHVLLLSINNYFDHETHLLLLCFTFTFFINNYFDYETLLLLLLYFIFVTK
jgi:hypothetical protein